MKYPEKSKTKCLGCGKQMYLIMEPDKDKSDLLRCVGLKCYNCGETRKIEKRNFFTYDRSTRVFPIKIRKSA